MFARIRVAREYWDDWLGILAAKPDGSGVRMVAETGFLGNVAVSPDGSRIAIKAWPFIHLPRKWPRGAPVYHCP